MESIIDMFHKHKKKVKYLNSTVSKNFLYAFLEADIYSFPGNSG